MDRSTALQHFREQEVIPLLNHQLDLLEASFYHEQTELIEGVLASFRQLCSRIRHLQDRNEQRAIGYIHYSLLRTQMLERSYLYMIEAYSAEWYTDDSEVRCTYDASWAYAPLGGMMTLLEQKRKRYIDSIHSADVERMVLELVPFFHQYVKALLRLALPEATQMSEYQGILKNSRLFIRTGEYKDFSESLYIEDQEARKDEELVEQLLQADENSPYVYENLRQFIQPHFEVEKRDLRYNDFSYSELRNSRFYECILIGCRWQHAILNESSFEDCLLTDADFRYSQLADASFRGASGHAKRKGEERSPGLCGLHFEHACLNGADFTDTQDFEHAYFEGASLEGARVPQKYSQSWKLSQAQFDSIVWTE